MSLQVEKLEKNMAKLTVEVPAEQFEAALKTSYSTPIIRIRVNSISRASEKEKLRST